MSVISGLKTALIEKFDFASGTSSRSTKLIHGGVRYLQKAIFNLDKEQVNAIICHLIIRFIFLVLRYLEIQTPELCVLSYIVLVLVLHHTLYIKKEYYTEAWGVSTCKDKT